ncbi:MAG: GNAT family N-acetyltransferase [Staphylococcus equorum]|uniref:GNAT family N-acetyltransferase n=1 Tax=Staphylococcus TaxID=1279 RepID=UPI000623D75E|nr:GNAT family N-acetyltransferase [Staphylococcus equorum]KKI52858.1 spermine/spermidine acetyltransferase blt [Staphylococcus equorum subsp. equorum]MDG0823628.1 GNAT family N-acetyltransferase [Staphylococcus equorum]MDG0838770.1 GNAT family N-acetyltransferase [Staphylococcus equorum]MDK9872892.1 GNAT family N-acetyltransferase [Staphylococcus equorum]MDK9878220.1 GNAT family N-acetyltransferase [Staphylococcus equorum]
MFIKKQFEGITVQVYEDKYKDALYNFKLNERQQIYSSLPSEVLEDALQDKDRIANIALNKKGEVVGFFVLHQYYQHEGYDTPKQVIYVRSLSVNQNFQGYGYGTKMMMYLPQYVQSLFPDFNHLYLVVDAENESAWNVYERAGFMHTATKEEGPLGKERLYYLDLDSNHVSSLKLKPNTEDVPFNIHIIDLYKDGNKVGFIAVEKHEQRMNISSVEVNKAERHHGIAESALRQLSTYIRKHFDDVSLLTITLYGENNELKPLCINSNFVEIESADDFKVFEKHINY